MKAKICSEVGPLGAVVVHRPGAEFERMEPVTVEAVRRGADGGLEPNPDYLLFDDLVLPTQLRREHDALFDVLSAAVGRDGAVRDFSVLLRRALFDGGAREELIDVALETDARTYEWSPEPDARTRLLEMDPQRLADALIRGYDAESGAQLFRWPAPNLLFARDIAAVVGDAAVLTYARHPAREREMACARWVFQREMGLEFGAVVDIAAAGKVGANSAEPLALEGGDILVLSERVVAVGVGHRTTWSAVQRLLPQLFARGVEVALVALLPQKRAAMHLDTVFTLVSDDQCLAYAPVFPEIAAGTASGRSHSVEPETIEVLRIDPTTDLSVPPRPLAEGLFGILAKEGLCLEPILCGGADPIQQAREQWSDGANAFVLAPGKILCYGRNLRTLDELNTAGFEIWTAPDFCRNARLLMNGRHRKVAVTIDGSELSRGRGGPRCLTLPVVRD